MPMYADEIAGPCAAEHAELDKAWAEIETLEAQVKALELTLIDAEIPRTRWRNPASPERNEP